MNKLVIILIFIFSCNLVSAQKITASDLKLLQKKEDSLKTLSVKIIQGRNSGDRFLADSGFTKIFVRALKTRNSFDYPFDSLLTISRLSPPDSSFKIFTWQMVISDNVVRQHGAIQMRTADGSLKLFPLIDKSDITKNMMDTVGNNFGWIGAVYYNLVQTQAGGKTYYTLLGYDENNIRSNKKIIEVLTFENGEPVFGGSYFNFSDNLSLKQNPGRLILEYKKNASPRLVYDKEQDMIVYEHLVPEREGDDPKKKYTYVGDGDYEGIKWKDGKWVHINKVFTQVTKEFEEPVPNPIRDANGDIDPAKLKDKGLAGDETEDKPAKTETKTKITPSKVKIKKKQ
ncbi:MAG TPA: hypothetical protein VMY77_05460 [Chitinophagaceae bacterium]|nr:hypothetical protein [Chitinophagaceae bacterium]